VNVAGSIRSGSSGSVARRRSSRRVRWAIETVLLFDKWRRTILSLVPRCTFAPNSSRLLASVQFTSTAAERLLRLIQPRFLLRRHPQARKCAESGRISLEALHLTVWMGPVFSRWFVEKHKFAGRIALSADTNHDAFRTSSRLASFGDG
jgi:hypothetical protein